MIFKIEIESIQQINNFSHEFDLSTSQIYCIAGKNSIGKTTFIRAIKNITSADTFNKTASPYIFSQKSKIKYVFNGTEFIFKYIPKINTIDSKEIIPVEFKNEISVELPIPHGIRFNHLQKLWNIDEELRTKISLKQYSVPTELISFLSIVYGTERFNGLKEITIKKEKYYFILKDDNYYIREDYLSSGEYFVINLFKLIQQRKKLIVIDEIDISLDASAQTKLIGQIRDYCKTHGVNVIFTTHSLPLMKTLMPDELYYMEENEGKTYIKHASYNYIKSILYGFKGWDKYILTEDRVLSHYINHLITKISSPIFYNFIVIYAGGCDEVIDLMERNNSVEFFCSAGHVISILDGDAKSKFPENENILYIPFQYIEHQVYNHYAQGDFQFTINITGKRPEKNCYSQIIRNGHMSEIELFEYINSKKENEIEELKNKILNFLSMH